LTVPGSTYVSEDTFKLTEGLFRFEALGEFAVKGKEEPVKAYRVITPSTSRTRFDVSAERGLTPFVGRERELELLLDGFDRSKAGRGQAFSIVAEAGVGKSRLLYEFRKVVANEDVFFQEGKCLSYSRDVTYHPVIDIVKSNSDIVEGDGDFEIRKKLKQHLKSLGIDETSTLPYFLELLSVEESGIDKKTLSPEARKDRIIDALNRGTIKASQIRPLILAVEDLHWIDNNSEDTLKALLDSISGERIFLIFTYRPEYVHTWGAKSYHSQITLNRLSNRESLVMVSHLLSTENIDSDLEDLILEKTEGVPFFIEEFTKSLKDLNIIERTDSTYHLAKEIHEVTIPSTIHDVIMARVDMLPEGAKELLQIGAVIEREFSYELIKQVSDLSEQEILSRLSVSKDAELLFERGIYPESTYIFKHAMTQEVVYDSILNNRKKKLHEKIGHAIEQLFKNNIGEYSGVLVEHFISGENYDKGAEYCRLAGRKAEKAGSINDAVAYGDKQVACLERLPQTKNVEKNLIDARTVLGLYYSQMGFYKDANSVINPIVELAIKRNYKRRISQIYCIIGAYNQFNKEDSSKAIEYLEKSLEIGEELQDLITLVLANTYMSNCLLHNCEFDKSLYHLEKALEINVAANVLWGIAAIKTWIAFRNNLFLGKIDLGFKTGEEVLRIANKSGDIYSKAHAYSALGWSYYCKGYLKKAEEYFLQCADFSERIQLFFGAALARFGLGRTYFDMEEYKTSQKHFERAISLFRQAGLWSSWINYSKMAIIDAML
jgi:predicted ATPase